MLAYDHNFKWQYEQIAKYDCYYDQCKFGKMFPKTWTKPKLENYFS